MGYDRTVSRILNPIEPQSSASTSFGGTTSKGIPGLAVRKIPDLAKWLLIDFLRFGGQALAYVSNCWPRSNAAPLYLTISSDHIQFSVHSNTNLLSIVYHNAKIRFEHNHIPHEVLCLFLPPKITFVTGATSSCHSISLPAIFPNTTPKFIFVS